MKNCTKCSKNKELSKFGNDKRKRDGLREACKECYNKYLKSWREKNKDHMKAKHREWHLRNTYDLSTDEVNIVAIKQDNKCAICKEAKKLYIDHNHKTGKFRGLLCNNCNAAIGQVHESIEKLKSAIEYLGVNK